MGVMPSVGVFLGDPSPYLSEFWRKRRKTPNGYTDKRDRGLNLTPPVLSFERHHSATGGANFQIGIKLNFLNNRIFFTLYLTVIVDINI